MCLLIEPYQLKDFLGHCGAGWKTNQIFRRLGSNGKIMSPRAACEMLCYLPGFLRGHLSAEQLLGESCNLKRSNSANVSEYS